MKINLIKHKKNYFASKSVLVIGSGSIANKHIKILIGLKFKVICLIKSNSEKRRFSGLIRKKINFVNDLELKKKKNFLFVIIASSTYKHIKNLDFFSKKKINIFCEKPISNNLFLIKKVRNQLIKNKIHFFINYQLRQHNLVNKLKKIIKSENIYSVYLKVGHNVKYWRKNKARNKSYYLDVKKGGGVIFELVHEINLIRYLFGEIKIIKTIKKNRLQKNCEDQALSIFKTKNNIPGILVQDMISEKKERYVEILSSNKKIRLDFVKNKIFVKSKNISKVIKNTERDNQMNLIKKNILFYISWIFNKKTSLKFYDDAVKDLKICLKMHEKF